MLSEREAWLKLADLWDKAKVTDPHDRYGIEIENGDPSFGLCDCISDLRHKEEIITAECSYSMREKIRAVLPEKNMRFEDILFSYRWPTDTQEGAKSRAEFCRSQAELLRG